MSERIARVIALGTFDGLHPGHRAVIETCVRLARLKHAESAVYTFIENPKSLFGKAPRQLMTCAEKRDGLYRLGIQRVFEVHFTSELARLSPEEFIDKLIAEYNPVALVAGEDYSFGVRASGNTDLLRKLCLSRGIETVIVPLVKLDGEKISSTRIRNALDSGDTEAAKKLTEG